MKASTAGYFLLRNKITLFRCCFVITFLLIILPASLFGQDIANLDIEKVQDEGLTNNYITCINQDKSGFIWFGTREGLFRYDGYSFKAFRNFPGDSTTLANNIIEALYPEKNNLWIGSRSGLSCIDINTQHIKNFALHKLVTVYAILPKDDSLLWVGTSAGLYQFNKNNYHWKSITVFGKDIAVSSIVDDHKGHLYLTSLGGFYCYNKLTGAFKYYHPVLPWFPKDEGAIASFTKSALGHDGNLWMSTWGAGLVRFDPKTGEIKNWSHQTDDVAFLPYKIIMAMLPDEYGNIWLANKEGGLTIFNPSKNKFTNYPVEWRSDNKISSAVISLFRDRTGAFWIGTENGIFKYDPYSVHLSGSYLQLKTDTGIVPTYISPLTMLKDRDGLWWMGMYEGVFMFNPKGSILYNYNHTLGIPENMAVFNMTEGPDGVIWLTARNMLVKVVKKTVNQHTSFNTEIFKSTAISSAITSLYIDKEKRIWAGTHNEGIFRFDTLTKKFIPCNDNQTGSPAVIKGINTFCELSKDSLLIGSEHAGLLLLNTNTGRCKQISLDNMPADVTVNAIYKKGAAIWIGTEYNGLWETTTNFKKTVVVTINDGLPSMGITSIIGDRQNNLWLLTNSGVVKFREADKKITVFDKKDGIQNLDELNSMMTDDDGGIIIGGRGYIYSFNPDRIIKNTLPPTVFITSLKVFDKEYNVNTAQPVELNYNQNYFSLTYVALNYTHSRLNKYAYKMAGLDKQWIQAGPRRNVSYANLEEGTYTFYVKACNNEGVWNNVPAKLTIIISPPFWHRWWFYLLVFAMVTGIIYSLYMYNINQLKIRLQMRDKIARDLHDDIGSTLSGINIFSKIALQKIDMNEPGSRDLLEKISERSETTMDALSDIVWSINTRNDGMDNFLLKAKEYLTETLYAQGITYEFITDAEMERLKVGMIARKELYLIFKEAICNACKYAGCSFIHVSLKKNKDTCTLIIHDNGRGFNTEKIYTGNGIYNMKQRAEKMKGELHIESKKNKGTTVILNFRIPRYR